MTLPPNEICYQLTARASRRSTRKRTLACQPSRPLGPPVPRIARLMALAIKFQDLVDRGEVRDYADIARLGYVSRARLTQIMNLLLLAPDLQEQLLLSLATVAVQERWLRNVVKLAEWEEQRKCFTVPAPQAKSDL